MVLFILIMLPILFGVVICLRAEREARFWATVGTVVTLVWGVVVLCRFDFGHGGLMQLGGSWSWFPALGIHFSLGVDAVSLFLILLTVFLMPITVMGSYTAVNTRVKEFFIWLLILQAAMIGVFAARDILLFYICFEFTLIPMYFLIAVYGSVNRAKASTVFFLYTFTGSVITLAGLIYLAWFSAGLTGNWSFDIATLTASAAQMSMTQQSWVLLALLCGLAVKIPLFPVHTWLPLAHTEAPTAGSVLLAAVMLKLGTYGVYRFVLPMCPAAVVHFAPLIAVLCIIGIIYTALICWVQDDVKKLIAYSSVSHLGFCVLGLMALNTVGIAGGVAYMINHGLSTGALFLCVGMIYERYHTRAMDDYSGMARRMPIWATFTIFFILASVGLPGLNGFIGEFLSLVGAFVSGQVVDGVMQPGSLGPWYAAFAGFGMILAAIYLLYLAGRVIWGPVKVPVYHGDESGGDSHHGVKLPRDLSGREILVLAPIAVACVVLGVKPGVILAPLNEPIEQTVALLDFEGGRGEVIEMAAAVDDEGDVNNEVTMVNHGEGGE